MFWFMIPALHPDLLGSSQYFLGSTERSTSFLLVSESSWYAVQCFVGFVDMSFLLLRPPWSYFGFCQYFFGFVNKSYFLLYPRDFCWFLLGTPFISSFLMPDLLDPQRLDSGDGGTAPGSLARWCGRQTGRMLKLPNTPQEAVLWGNTFSCLNS